jgi:hypothetical protein
MNRIEFLKRLLRYGLLALLTLIVFALGKKVVTGNDCSSCTGNGICKGESDCSNFKVAGR